MSSSCYCFAIGIAPRLSRESLYRSLSDKGDPRLSTFLSVLSALNLQISLAPIQNNCKEQAALEEAF